MCREPMCKEIEPSKNIKIHLEDLEEEEEVLEEELEKEKIKTNKNKKIIHEVHDLMNDVEESAVSL